MLPLAIYQRHADGLVEVASRHNVGAEIIPLSERTSRPELTRSALLGKPGLIAAVLGTTHPQYPNGVHPSHLAAFNSIISHGTTHKLRRLDDILVERVEANAVIIGGPLGSSHAHAIFGNRGASPLLGGDLPVYFDLTRLNADRRDPRRYVCLVADGTDLHEEHLLITRLPMNNGHCLVSIAGLRGPGTFALEFLLCNDSLLNELYVRTRRMTGWQALFRVDVDDFRAIGLRHDFRLFEINSIDFDRENYLLSDPYFLDKCQYDWYVSSIIQLQSQFKLKSLDHISDADLEREVRIRLKRGSSFRSLSQLLTKRANADEAPGKSATIRNLSHSASETERITAQEFRSSLPALPSGLNWPTEHYSESPDYGKQGGVLSFLNRVWRPLIEIGYGERRFAAGLDPSLIEAIKAYTRRHRVSKNSRQIPKDLRLLTITEARVRRASLVGEATRPDPKLLRAQAYRLEKGKAT